MRFAAAVAALLLVPAAADAAALEKRLTRSWVIFSGAVEGSVPRHPVPGRARALGRGPVGVTVGGQAIRRGPVRAGKRLLGYLRDGFRLYSVQGSPRLDRCHGRFVRVRGRRSYQYVATPSSPFVARCFRTAPRRFVFPLSVDVPGVTPPLSPGVTDHVTRACDGALRVSASAPRGGDVVLDGEALPAGPSSRLVPVRADQAFDVVVQGAVHHVRCLPADFPSWEVSGGPGAADVYLLSPSILSPAPYLVATDRNLTPVWWRWSPAVALDLKDLSDGSLVWWRPIDVTDFAYEQRRPDGTFVRTWRTVGTETDNHDLVELPNGNALLLAYPERTGVDLTEFGHGPDETVFEGEVQEVAPDGSVVRSWSTLGRIGLEETGRWWSNSLFTLPNGLTGHDRVHLNSIEVVPGGMLLSARHTDAIYKIGLDGEVVWKLGGTPTPRSLSGGVGLGGPHDARLLPDGTVTLLDNGTGLGRSPRALRVAVDEVAMTARVIEEVRDPAVERSDCCGSARRLPGGRWLVSWGGFVGNVSELDGSEVVWRLRTSPGFTYRTVPARYVTVDDLRAAMDARFSRAGTRGPRAASPRR